MATVRRRHLLHHAMAALMLSGSRDAWAAEAGSRTLRIASATDATSMDPHLQYFGPDRKAHRHIFEGLLASDERQRLQPALAESWRPLDGRTWEFRLRRGVLWHDGLPLTADDVAFSLNRAPHVPGGASPLSAFTQSVERVEIPDPMTVLVRTKTVAPLAPNELANIFIVSRRHSQGATTADFNRGDIVIGTGPYRFVAWNKGVSLRLKGFAQHWAGPPEWDDVRLDTISDDDARVLALTSGAADIADQLPPGQLAHLRGAPGVSVAECASNFLLFLNLDQFRESSPYITARDGSTIRNPLLNGQVRKALSMGIDRKRLSREVMQGAAESADQLLPDGFTGHVAGTLVEPFDPAAACAMLAEAGYRDGWRMTLHGTRDRYSNDGPLLEAVARDWRALGLAVAVVSLPFAEFFPRASSSRDKMPEFSVTQVGWGTPTGEPSSTLRALLETPDAATGAGASNRGRFSDPAVDRIVGSALAIVDDMQREALLEDATRLAVGQDRGIIPLVYPRNFWGVRRRISYTARADNQTSAMDAHRAE